MGPKTFLSSVPRARRLYNVGVLLGILGSLAMVAWTIMLARAISDLVQQEDVTPWILGLAVFIALHVGFRFASAIMLAKSSIELRTGLRLLVATNWRSDPNSAPSTGVAGTLLGPGIDSLDDYITKFLPARSIATVLPIAIFLTIGLLDRWTLLILLFAGPMLVLLLAVIGSRTRSLADQRFQELGWLRSFYLDMVRGIPTLKVFGRANESVATVGEISTRFGRTTMAVLRTAFQTSLVIEWAATAATALVAVQVSFRMVEGEFAFPAALTVLMLTPEFFAPLRNLATEYHAGQTGIAVLTQLSELTILSPVASPPSLSPTIPPDHPMVVEFDDVSFCYVGNSRPVLDGLSFTINAGETIVLIGPSGAGKSTLLGLFMGRLRPTRGQITVNGIPLTDIDHSEWLRRITSVPQDPFMFCTSVRDNVSFSRTDATDEEIHDALELARASEFVAELPFGIESKVGEDGMNLSGGQRQRLAIARAVLRDAPIVVLDEFSAHLDPITEKDLIDEFKPFLDDRIALVVAHREATLALADRVLRLEHGHLHEVTQWP